MQTIMKALASVALLLPALGEVCAETPPDAIWHNGNVHTMDFDRPRAEALAVREGRIIAVGSDAGILALAGEGTARHDLGGRTVLPGLIDAHGHLPGLGGFGLGRLDLSTARSFDELIAMSRLRADELRATGQRAWVQGGRWDHESWPGRELPTHHALSEAIPDVPVWLRRVDGHAGLANAAALRLAGITSDTESPPGGEIIRDADGAPTGVLVDHAMVLVERVIGGAEASTEALLLRAQEMCLAAGLTGVHEAGMDPSEIAVLQTLARDGRWKLRTYVMVSGGRAIEYFREHGVTIDPRVTVRSCKLYMDGAMGSRGAWLLEGYSDRPTDESGAAYTGLNLTAPEQIERIALDALQNGYQVCTHAIGDRANREVLAAYQRALERHPNHDHRFRIEHAQLIALEDAPRFARLGVIASMQPTHCTSDMRWVDARVGPRRARGAYAWATLLRSGARIAAGSDFPVESHNPFLGFHAAVTRQDADGHPPEGWLAGERMTRSEALRAFTLDAAYAGFAEDSLGSLRAGKWADFIVIDRDVMRCAPSEILQTRVLETVIAGERVHVATGSDR